MPGWTTDSADVVVFGIVPWTARWQRPHHVARELAGRGHRVVYVTPHFVIGRQRWRELDEDTCPDRVVLAQLSTISKTTIHEDVGWTVDDVSHAHHTFWRAVDDLRLRCPILFVQSPAWWPLVSWLRERTDFPLVYDCLDEHTGWNPVNAAEVRAWEEELARSADLVLASAPPLEERMRALAPSVVSVPNGCDFDHFAPASDRNGVLRPPLDGPIVGYYGAISSGWFDAGLVVSLAESRPDWSIVLIGPADPETRDLLDPSPNVVQLGEVAYSQLPRYCADFDVAIIPFLVNDLTAATDPVKLYEYFAAGKPVVTTPLPAVYAHQGPLVVADTAAAFERAIEVLLEEPGDREERREIARAASWDRRVDAFYEPMLACLPTLDVIVLTHNGAELTRRCLASIEADGSHLAHVIVVDNASTDGTGALLDEVERRDGATVIRSAINAGFANGVNQGIGAGSGRYILVLNNDTEIPRGALLAFVNALARSRDVGLLGPVTNSIGNEAEIYTPYDVERAGELSGWFRELAFARFGLRFDIDAAALFAAIVRREDLDRVGGLPEHYQVGMFEDDELAERIRALGKRVVCAEDVFVHHFGGAAFRTIDPVVYQAIFDRNRRVFEAAVGRPWRPHTYRPDKTRPAAKSGAPETRDEAPGSQPWRKARACRPRHSYFVCGSPRCGTNLLGALLQSSRLAGRPDEYFFRDLAKRNREAWGIPPSGDYLSEVLRRGTTRNGVFGARVMWWYFHDFLRELRALCLEPITSDIDLISSSFPDPRYLWISREDVVAQAVSWTMADQTRQWVAGEERRGEARFDFDQINERVRLALDDRAGWKSWFERNGLRPFTLTYEELVADTTGVTKSALGYLGLSLPDDAVIDAMHMVRQSDAVNDEWSASYRSLAGLDTD